MNVKLTKVDTGTSNISIIGETERLPQEGYVFEMSSKVTADSDVCRHIRTSIVTDADVLDNIITFSTESGSVYTLEVL